jgi:lipid II:glycine glycyltransferase (peptidoglycan interpeptide bridge formation enzyme)
MPWVLKKRFGVKVICQPALTQTLGPWLEASQPGTKYAKRLAREKDLMEALIDQLPSYDVFRQSFAPEITNWLPFFWRHFCQTTRYTYRISLLAELQAVWSQFQPKVKTDIRKAERHGVQVERSGNIDEFLNVNELTFARQGMKPPCSRAYVKRLFSACEQNNAGAIFLARGKDGRVHAGNLIVWNQDCAYYLMGGGDPALRNSGATSLAMWHAIQFASTVSRIFDFEGSMIEPVERFFRGFGAVQTPYFSLTHVRSKCVATALGLRSTLGALLR